MNLINKNLLLVRNLGRISYNRFVDVQNGINSNSNSNNNEHECDKNILLLAEHSSPLFSFSNNNNKFDNNNNNINNDENSISKYKRIKQLGYDVCKVSKRNNDDDKIVLHGPGQLTVYPILSNQNEIDQEQYKMKLGNVVLNSLNDLSIKCKIENDLIKTNKNEVIGNIKIFNDFYKLPGFFLNVNTNFEFCNDITSDKNVSSIWKITNSQSITVSDVIPIVSEHFKKEFGLQQIDPYSYYLSQYNQLEIPKTTTTNDTTSTMNHPNIDCGGGGGNKKLFSKPI